MGDKLTALQGQLDRMKKDDPVVRTFDRAVKLLQPPYYIPGTDPVEYVLPEGTLELAEEVIRLDAIKSLATALEKSTSEYVKEVKLKLHELMSTVGPTGFTTKSGFRFSMTSTNYVQALPELGGTGNPELKQWLKDNGMPDVAEGTINANTFKSSVNTWMRDNPIEATKQVGDDHVMLAGAELLEALGIDEAELARRQAEHDRINAMARITSEPAISVTKA